MISLYTSMKQKRKAPYISLNMRPVALVFYIHMIFDDTNILKHLLVISQICMILFMDFPRKPIASNAFPISNKIRFIRHIHTQISHKVLREIFVTFSVTRTNNWLYAAQFLKPQQSIRKPFIFTATNSACWSINLWKDSVAQYFRSFFYFGKVFTLQSHMEWILIVKAA